MKDLEAALAEKNGYSNELYVQRVRQGAKKDYPFTDDEIAIIRKELAFHRELFKILFNESLPDNEFSNFNFCIENIKKYNKYLKENSDG